ncbi:hypothetical protein [Pandoraea terrigena]|uniref:Uncharacterized protein n=1 Tax=Pandoraea terrigena TaxID=2508292 RepID=A0A5E4SY40_9BURK|nr:hypothetical protein [Pandoraea terrigena]VVD79104.1 hypothetical protein PTE31013_01008 [Pandoraea terrigena]
MNGIQAFHYSPGMGNVAALAPIALAPGAGPANAAGISLVRVANARADSVAHPWTSRDVHAVPVSRGMDKAFGSDFLGVSTETEASGEVATGQFIPEGDGTGRVELTAYALAGPTSGATRGAQPVLSASAMQTLHVCASAQNVHTRGVSPDGRNHPVFMPNGRSERAQICRDIVNGSLLGTAGRNGTVAFDTGRDDVTTIVADTARRWTGKSALAGKKEWSKACEELESPATFIAKVNERLHQGSRVLPSRESTEWMLRVGFADGLPMHQAMVRADLPPSVGLGTDEWIKLALGVEQVGERHWELRHSEVMDAAALPATNTKAFTALATSMSSRPPHIATQRLRNQLAMRGVPTIPASTTIDPSAKG